MERCGIVVGRWAPVGSQAAGRCFRCSRRYMGEVDRRVEGATECARAAGRRFRFSRRHVIGEGSLREWVPAGAQAAGHSRCSHRHITGAG